MTVPLLRRPSSARSGRELAAGLDDDLTQRGGGGLERGLHGGDEFERAQRALGQRAGEVGGDDDRRLAAHGTGQPRGHGAAGVRRAAPRRR